MVILLRRLALDPKWSLLGLGMIGVGVAIVLFRFPETEPEDSIWDLAQLWFLVFIVFDLLWSGVKFLSSHWVFRSADSLRVRLDRLPPSQLRGVSAGIPNDNDLPSYCPVLIFDGPDEEFYWKSRPNDDDDDNAHPTESCLQINGLSVVDFMPNAEARIWRRVERLARWLDVAVVDLPASAKNEGLEPVPAPPARSLPGHGFALAKGIADCMLYLLITPFV